MRIGAWVLIVVMAASVGCAKPRVGGGPRGSAARQAALAWATGQEAADYFHSRYVLKEMRDFRVDCATTVPVTEMDQAEGVTAVWCVRVAFLGRVRTFDGATPPWDEHSIGITVKSIQNGPPAVKSWADCLCGAAAKP